MSQVPKNSGLFLELASTFAAYAICIAVFRLFSAPRFIYVFVTYVLLVRQPIVVLRREGRLDHAVFAVLSGPIAYYVVLTACAVLSVGVLGYGTPERAPRGLAAVAIPLAAALTLFGIMRLRRWWRDR